jgi:hypothetical protein
VRSSAVARRRPKAFNERNRGKWQAVVPRALWGFARYAISVWPHAAFSQRATCPPSDALKPQIIVVDNESTETTYSALSAAVPGENLICSTKNCGYAGGNNLGIKRALAAELEFVLLLYTDAEISSAGVSQLLARLNACTQIAIIGPVVNEVREELAWRRRACR